MKKRSCFHTVQALSLQSFLYIVLLTIYIGSSNSDMDFDLDPEQSRGDAGKAKKIPFVFEMPNHFLQKRYNRVHALSSLSVFSLGLALAVFNRCVSEKSSHYRIHRRENPTCLKISEHSAHGLREITSLNRSR